MGVERETRACFHHREWNPNELGESGSKMTVEQCDPNTRCPTTTSNRRGVREASWARICSVTGANKGAEILRPVNGPWSEDAGAMDNVVLHQNHYVLWVRNTPIESLGVLLTLSESDCLPKCGQTVVQRKRQKYSVHSPYIGECTEYFESVVSFRGTLRIPFPGPALASLRWKSRHALHP